MNERQRAAAQRDASIIATGLFQPGGDGFLPRRAVLRDLGDQFVVHTQCFDEDEAGSVRTYYRQGVRTYYRQGHYFPKPKESDAGETLRRAWHLFDCLNARIHGFASPERHSPVAFVTIENGNLEDTRGIGECIIVTIDWDEMEVAATGEVEAKIGEILDLGLPGEQVEDYLTRLRRILDDADLDDEDDIC